MNGSLKRHLYILFSCFLLSRVIIKLLGVTFGYNALYDYWQYLDVISLKTNLLQSLWYQHSQPPVFNLLLGIILKVSGRYNPYAMQWLLMAITLSNGLLLLSILRRIIYNKNISLIISLLYILSPATMLFENELFYTSFISFLLLLSVRYMVMVRKEQSWQNIAGMFASLSLVCLTRSMYHLIWLVVISVILLITYLHKEGFRRMLLIALLSISAVGGWYLKNYLIFGSFTASSWMGMNFSRIVFHNDHIPDSSDIASIPPFMPISYYKNFISADYNKRYAGINDRILLMETKNNRYLNMNNAGYLEVSKKYTSASFRQVHRHSLSYFKNAVTAFIIFFTPASSYYKVTENNQRIRYFDLVYSFNPAHIVESNAVKKQLLVIAAIPKFLLYGFTFFILIREGFTIKSFSFLNIFIVATILFSVTVSSLLDYGENMRFRYEIEPLFLILAAQAIMLINQKIRKPSFLSNKLSK